MSYVKAYIRILVYSTIATILTFTFLETTSFISEDNLVENITALLFLAFFIINFGPRLVERVLFSKRAE